MTTLIQNSSNKKYLSIIMLIALPISIQGLVFQLQSLTEKAFLGNIDTKYLSAIGATQFPLGATIDSIIALCTGITILVSQMYGAKKTDGIVSTVKSSIAFNTIISGLFFILWFVFPRYIFNLLGVDAAIMDYCMTYAQICSIGFLFLGIDSALQSMLLGMGDTRPILYAGTIKVFLNIVISWVLIFGKFGLPPMYIKGAAIGTVIANVTSSIFIIIYCLIIRIKEFGLGGRFYSFDLSSYKKTFMLGLPTAIEFFAWNFSNLVLLGFLNGISYIATTIYTLTFGIEIIVFQIFNGYSKAALTLIGNKIGENDPPGAKRAFNLCMRLTIITVIISCIILILFPKAIIDVFSNEDDVILKTVPFLIFTAFIIAPKCINVLVGSGIRAYGDTKWMLYTQIFGSLFVITCSFILVKIASLGVTAVYITIFLDECTRAAINYHHYLKGDKSQAFSKPIIEQVEF